ncbi:MAG: S41 family peptidase [Lachnospiraceae bacterium]|nr:S41 family peptidase [Lachnospiraceae bacterium]
MDNYEYESDYTKDEELEQTDKKKFRNGMFWGALIGIVIGAIVTTITAVIVVNSINKSKENAVLEVPEDKIEKLEYLYNLIDRVYLEDIDEDTMMEGIYEGLLDAVGDPYTEYYTKEEFDKFKEEMSGEYYGIGVMVSQDLRTNIITVTNVFEGAPSYEAGMQAGDIIYKVSGTDITSMSVSEVVSMIKGAKGSKVEIVVVRDGEEKTFSVERRPVAIPSIESKMLEDNIGYIQIVQFEDNTDEQYVEAFNKLVDQGMKALVVDVRDNPGGSLDTVVNILDTVLPKGLIVYTIDKNGNKEEHKGKDNNEINIPLVVLTNGNSASASEIFAAAIQDYEKGTIIGTTTYGKGIVQRLIPFSDGTAIKITISTYYSPKGNNIHGEGVTPDIELEYDGNQEEDNQLKKAIEVLKEQM